MTRARFVHTLDAMAVEWDTYKQRENLRKHGIEFADAVMVLEDPAAITIEDTDHDEQRFVGLGHRFGHPGSVGILPATARRAGSRSHGPRGNAALAAPAARLSHTARRFGGSRVAEMMTKAAS